jgi:DtxR family transcriptional regulator, Mn-dependent transcriptional regulator
MSVHGHSIDDYLETIYFLAFPVGEYGPVVKDQPALSARIGEMLGVSRASVSEMIKRLENEGLVERGERKEAILTESGKDAAERVVRRHRLIECFLTQFLGYTPAEAHEQADVLGATFTDDMIERTAERLGYPERCPHGWPVNPDQERAENLELRPLNELAVGAHATIIRLAEHDGELLNWFYDSGLTPGTAVEITERDGAGELRLVVGDGSALASDHAASGLFVLPAAEGATAK